MALTADIGIFTTDTTLVVQTWDGWLAEATGIPREDAVGRALADLLPDVVTRGFLERFHEALTTGAVQVLAPALHHYLIPCALRTPSARFEYMQQRVTIGPLRDRDHISGVMVAIEDVTARLEAERELAEALASEDPRVRKDAADAVRSAEGPNPPDALAPALADDNWRVRQAAVHGLASAADPNFMRALVATLRHEHRNFALLSSALKLLAVTNVDITAPLAELLQEHDADVRIQAALALGEQHDPAAVPPLMGALHDPDVNVRFQAIESLGRLRADAAVDDLIAIVESGDFFLAFAALDALAAIADARIAPRLVPLLESETFRVPVADALGALGDERAVVPLVMALNSSPSAAVSTASALARIYDRFEREYHDGTRIADVVRRSVTTAGQQSLIAAVRGAEAEQLPALVRVLSWFEGPEIEVTLTHLLGEAAVRNEVIEALVRHGERVVDRVIEQLSSDDPETQHAAVVALGRLGSHRATNALVALLDGDSHLLVPVAGALARIGDRAAFEPLLTLLGHPDGSVRQSAIGALNSIGHPQLPERVERLLQNPDPLVRESAVRIAGYFGYAQTVDRMFECTRDEDETVRRAALEHIAFLDNPRVLPTLLDALERDTPQARAAAARALARIDKDEARAGLAAALSDEDSWVRYFAARALAEHCDSAVFDALVGLAESDPAAQVRIASIDAIGSLRDRRAVPLLQRLTADRHEEVAAAALTALGRVAQADGLPALLEAVRSDSSARRSAAVQALAAHGSAEAVASLEWTAAADPDPAVWHAAIDGLGMVAGSGGQAAHSAVDALVTLLSDTSRREAAARVVAKLPPARIGDVARGLRHPHPSVRSGTVEALGRFQREDATRLILAALEDTSPVVREAAVVTLARVGALGIETAFAGIAAQDPSKAVRRAAATALARIRT
jgi:HEAT repeat protein